MPVVNYCGQCAAGAALAGRDRAASVEKTWLHRADSAFRSRLADHVTLVLLLLWVAIELSLVHFFSQHPRKK
ncbi:hypothetical protein [Pseudomonas parafulva]|uniref:hypothetical protein n=1 Tax=Pseudomonas parafulva TaxID=157782 RepID=UPI0012D36BD2|nr:hypothetical protein [Pseudomonas parafulva]